MLPEHFFFITLPRDCSTDLQREARLAVIINGARSLTLLGFGNLSTRIKQEVRITKRTVKTRPYNVK
jgi:hypothetical protein